MKLKEFNKEERFHQLRSKTRREYNVKNRTLVLSIGILILSVIYFTYAKYESVSNDFTIVNATVGDFVSDFAIISYMYDDGSGSVTSHSVPPAKNTGYSIDNVNCTNGTGTWDSQEWGLNVRNITGKVRCNLSFSSGYAESLLNGAAPELYDGMVPIIIEDGTNGTVKGRIRVADTSQEWYSYEDHNWANAALVTSAARSKAAGQELNVDTDILQMYVWIPRYKYQLWNAEFGSSNPQSINIVFENENTTKSTGSTNGSWLTHPAFTFG